MSCLDMVGLVIGIVIGVSIFKSPALIFANAGSAAAGMGFWIGGALIALCGALCYSELAAAYPEFGAEYAYLSRAYGRRFGLLFAWMQVFAVVTGNLGAMAFVFADYLLKLVGVETSANSSSGIACAAVIFSWLVHLTGDHWGRRAQNLLSACKIGSLVMILLAGIWIWLRPPIDPVAVVSEVVPREVTWSGWGLALLFTLFAYGGWNDATSVAPDVVDCRRNVPRALLLSLALITALYLGVNAVYLGVLGYDGLSKSTVPAADVMSRALGPFSARLLSGMVLISSMGAIHGLMLTGTRLLQGVGETAPWFARLSHRTPNGSAPWALSLIMVISLALIAMAGTPEGQDAMAKVASLLNLPPPDYKRLGGGFGVLVSAASAIFYVFLLLTGLAVIVLRIRDPHRARPFKIPLYPLPPVIFTLVVAWMLWSAAIDAKEAVLLLSPVLLIGVVVAWLAPVRGV